MAVRREDISDEVDIDRDRALVFRYQQGDEEAFAELYRRYFPRLHLYCRRRVGDLHVAEELAQESFVRALRAMPQFAGDRRFYPWMTVIAQRLCIDHHRSAGRSEPTAELDPGSVEADPGDVFLAVDRGHLAAALERVAPRHKEVLQLREQEGWSYQQIADHLDVPMTTVEALLHRARKALKREFLAVGGGRLSAIPILGGFAAFLARARAKVQQLPDSAVPLAGAAAAGIAVVGVIAAPFNTEAPKAPESTTTAAAPVVATSASPATPLPSDPVVVVATPAAAATVAPAASEPAPPDGVPIGPATIYTTPEGADHAGDQAVTMPIHISATEDIRAGLDPANVAGWLATALGGNP